MSTDDPEIPDEPLSAFASVAQAEQALMQVTVAALAVHTQHEGEEAARTKVAGKLRELAGHIEQKKE